MFGIGEITVASLLSLLVGGVVGHFLAKDRARQDRSIARFNEAAAALKHAFANELTFLRGAARNDLGYTYDQLKSAFPEHEKAIFAFREHLSKHEQPAFDAAWRQYYFPEGLTLTLPDEETPTHILGQYFSLDHEEEMENKKLALRHIEKLLAFAKEK